MPTNAYFHYLQACLSLVSTTLGKEESILLLEQGQTRYGKQTFAFYRVRIGTFKNMTGNTPMDLRSAVIEVNVDPPHYARVVDASNWQPLPQ
jgi:hypothetical protein